MNGFEVMVISFWKVTLDNHIYIYIYILKYSMLIVIMAQNIITTCDLCLKFSTAILSLIHEWIK